MKNEQASQKPSVDRTEYGTNEKQIQLHRVTAQWKKCTNTQ